MAVELEIDLLPGSDNPPSSDDLERMFTSLVDAHTALGQAALDSAESVCASPTPTAESVSFSRDAYLALAAATNRRIKPYRANGLTDPDPIAAARGMLQIEQNAVATIRSWTGAPAEAQALADAIDRVVAGLRAASTAVSASEAISNLRVAALERINERTAAEELRKRLGLPPLKDGDAL